MVTGSLRKTESSPKTSIVAVIRDQLLAHIRYAQSTLIRPFCSDKFQECVGLQRNKSGNYWSFPSNKESYSRKATWQPARVCLLNHSVGILHSIPVLDALGPF